MGLHLPRSATRIKLCSRCHDTHAGVHLRIVFALGDAHIDMRMRMSCARGDGARPITESGKSACGSSTARSSSVSGVPSTLGLSAATYGAPTVTRVPLAPVFFFVGCPTVPVALVFFFAACPAVRSLLCPSRFGSYHETAETAIVGLFGPDPADSGVFGPDPADSGNKRPPMSAVPLPLAVPMEPSTDASEHTPVVTASAVTVGSEEGTRRRLFGLSRKVRQMYRCTGVGDGTPQEVATRDAMLALACSGGIPAFVRFAGRLLASGSQPARRATPMPSV